MDICRLTERLLTLIYQDKESAPVQGLNLFHSQKDQNLRSVPIVHPSVILVLSGKKQVTNAQGDVVMVSAGEGILVPGNSQLTMVNFPDQDIHHYLAVALAIQPELLGRFLRDYAPESATAVSSLVSVTPEVILHLNHWLQLSELTDMNDAQIELCVLSLLTFLHTQASLEPMMVAASSWKQKLFNHINSDLSKNWTLEEVCADLGTSASSLRRHLQQEGSGFRELLEDTRLVSALCILQETFWPISQVAQSVGYQSQSRFSERFKLRFGLSPSELRKTRGR
ncbi:helix-turn-helix transcriptional regulator [Litoribacillus peritrichatus]|uniref:AraC family transcriptional regulator n=1 Tax=Litoribacillus peritrichatus TaxID=718191 RepID=A0ABP7MHC5_9GAMM